MTAALALSPSDVRAQAASIHLPLLDILPERVQAAMLDRATQRRVPRGTPLFWQGDRLSTLPVLCRGYARLIRNTRSGREVVADISGPGDPLCWTEVLRDEGLPLSAIALEECVVVQLPVTPVRHCLSTDTRVALAWARLVEDRYTTLLDQVAETRAPSVPARLGGLLLHLLERHGVSRTGEVPIRLTRQDLADAAGTTVETAIRIMRKWEKAGWVESHRDGLVIRDASSLRDAADGLDG